jgi:AcrR family transcriptional regulator
MPRPYRLGQRKADSEQTRQRILIAARELLMAPEGISGFSMDAVARRADVARMTVYYQFNNKVGLLETLSDMLASQGGMEEMPAAFTQPDARAALATYITILCRFYENQRLVARRMNALIELDPELAQVLQNRNEWRRQGLHVLVERHQRQYGQPTAEAAPDIIDSLFTLLSFPCCDMLAGPTRAIMDIIPLVQRIALAVLALPGPEQTIETARSPDIV